MGNGKRAFRVLPLFAVFLLSACAVKLTPLTEEENTARVQSDRETIFANQEKINGPIMLEEAIARALSYNLDHRLKLMERAVGLQQLDVANKNMLPSVTANAGYDTRSRADSTFNEDRTDTSTTSDRRIKSGDLTVSWNVLDFGIGYIRARQQANLALIVEERRRQVIHNIVQDTRAAYWRAVAAERALEDLESINRRVEDALGDAEKQIEEQVDVVSAMVYQRTLLETLRQLGDLRRDMVAARSELAVLMNVHPDSEFVLSEALDPVPRAPTRIDATPDALELAALSNRSELRSESYQLRVFREEARAAMLEMIPGLSFSAGINYTSDSFKANQNWFSGSIDLAWNVLSLFQGPERIALAETQQELSKVRRLALSMAVIAQVHVAQLRLNSAIRDFELASRIAAIELDIQRETANAFAANQGSAQDVLEADVRAALAAFRRDVAYAEMQDGVGRLIASTGADPALDDVDTEKGGVMVLAGAVAKTLEGWESGIFQAPITSPVEEEDSDWFSF